MRQILSPLLLLILTSFLTFSGNASTCFEILHDLTQGQSLKAVNLEVQKDLIRFLKEQKVPSFIKKEGEKEIPVILVNDKSYPKLHALFNNSVGNAVSLHEGQADHGFFRVRNYLTDLYISNDSQYHGRYGELHLTGIAWKNLDEYIPKRTGDAINQPQHKNTLNRGPKRIIESVHFLSPEEIDAAEYYHRVRRAAFYRAPYSFFETETQRKGLPNFLKGGKEHCYTQPTASASCTHRSEILELLKTSYDVEWDQFSKIESIQTLRKYIKGRLLGTDPYQQSFNHYDLVNDEEYLGLLNQALPGHERFDRLEKIKLMNLLASVDAIDGYQSLMKELSVRGGSVSPQGQRTTALFVYNAYADEDEFFKGTYTIRGSGNGINQNGNQSLFLDEGQ
ncbi:MAG: hypothetical protein ACPGJV_15725 [Bacteriovoracaceae bacterium]